MASFDKYSKQETNKYGESISRFTAPAQTDITVGIDGILKSGGLPKKLNSENYSPYKSGWSLDPNGGAQFDNLIVNRAFMTVKVDGDIQSAINIMSANGGGAVQLTAGTYYPKSDIIGASNVSIKGAGQGVTVLDFGSQNYGVKYAGNTTTAYVENFAVTDLTIKDSDLTGFEEVGTRSGGLHIKYAKFFEVRNVVCTSCGDDGMKIEMGENFNVSNCQFDNNGVNGLEVLGTSYYATKFFTIQNCFADTNTKDGFQATYADVELGSFINCHADNNTQNGFYMTYTEAVSLIGCSSNNNTLHGFSLIEGSSNLIGCMADSNSTDGFYIEQGSTTLTGCQGRYSTGINFNVAGSSDGRRVALAGNVFDRLVSGGLGLVDIDDSDTVADANAAQSPAGISKLLTVVNKKGSTIYQGEVVVRKATATGYDIDTTTTQGDSNVFGMMRHDGDDNEQCDILAEGRTALLKADGEEDIAVGDWLQTSTVAGVSMRASTAGQTVFAKALTAYVTGATGTVAALLVTPRSI